MPATARSWRRSYRTPQASPIPHPNGGLDSIQSIRRILEIATIDTLGLDNSVVRSRTLISAAVAAAKLLETGELEARLATLELALGSARENQDAPSDGGLLGG